PDSQTVLELLDASRAVLRDALAGADGLALGSIKHTHPAFGELDLYQWVLFVGLHERRHAGQVSEVISALSAG
ncbi:MAG: DinB-like domain protein, partial [Gemmatimonadetes bacterium]|nr:DinB-like domain protein [Gemmatimonadota bacterium]